MPLRLTIFVPERPGATCVLADGRRYRVGRDSSADLTIDDHRVSREHLELDGSGPAWKAQDLGSKNGTRVDGVPVAEAEILRRSWFSVGGIPVLAEPVASAATDRFRTDRGRRRVERPALDDGVDPEVLVMRALESLRCVADCQRSAYWSYDDGGVLRARGSIGPDSPAPSMGVVRQVAATGRPVFCSDTDGAEALARRNSVVGGGLRAMVALPLRNRGRIFGVLYADSVQAGKVFTQLDAELLGGIADQLALILAASDLQAAAG